jgi:hypothetical protein
MNEIIKKNGIKFGLIAGVFSVLMTAGIYIVDLKLFTAWWLGFSSILIYIGIGIALMITTKKALHNIYSFKDAFTTYFIYAIIGILISLIFNILLFNVIDPSAKETVKELSIEAAVKMMQKFGTPTSVIKEAIEKMEDTNQFDVLELIKGSITSLIVSAIFGVIFAAIFKSKPSHQE